MARENYIIFRATEPEKRQAWKLAKEAGFRNLSDLMRHLLSDYAAQRPLPSPDLLKNIRSIALHTERLTCKNDDLLLAIRNLGIHNDDILLAALTSLIENNGDAVDRLTGLLDELDHS